MRIMPHDQNGADDPDNWLHHPHLGIVPWDGHDDEIFMAVCIYLPEKPPVFWCNREGNWHWCALDSWEVV